MNGIKVVFYRLYLLGILLGIICLMKFDCVLYASTIDPSGEYSYEINEDGKSVSINKYLGKDKEVVTIPEYIEEKKVIAIDDWAFESHGEITTIVISKYVSELGHGVFRNCHLLNNITIKGDLISVGGDLMEGTSWLDNQFLNSNYAILDDVLVDVKDLKGDVVIPDGVRVFCENSFRNNKTNDQIQTLTLPSSIEYIPRAYEWYDEYEKSYYQSQYFIGEIVKNLTGIYVASDNPYYISDSGILYDKNKTELIEVPYGYEDDVRIPASVEKIYWDIQFGGRYKIENIMVENTKVIEDLENPNRISSNINITDVNMKTILCGSSYNFAIENLDYTKDDNGTLIINGINNIEHSYDLIIPSMIDGCFVKQIKNEAFINNERVESVTIGKTVEIIGNDAFCNCQNLLFIKVKNDSLLSQFSQEIVNSISYATAVYDSAFNKYIQSRQYISDDGNYMYAYDKDGVVIIRYIGSETDVVVPDKIDNKAVIGIGHAAFSPNTTYLEEYNINCKNIEKITLPSTLKKIYKNAFFFSFITDINIPEGVEYIGDHAFCWSSLTKIKFCSTLKYIGTEAFSITLIKEVILPDNIEYVGYEAFGNNRYLEKIYIPASLKSRPLLNGNNTGLQEINVENGNKVYKSIDGVLFSADGRTLIMYPPKKIGVQYNVPDGVEVISNNAFFSEQINDENDDSEYLTELKIPKTVTSISPDAMNSYMLENISVDESNPSYRSVDGVLYSKDKKILISYPFGNKREKYEVDKNTEKICNGAFRGYGYLKDLYIYNNVNIIEEYAILDDSDGDYSITIYTVPDSTAFKYANNKGIECILVDQNSDVNDNENDINTGNNSENNDKELKDEENATKDYGIEQNIINDSSIEENKYSIGDTIINKSVKYKFISHNKVEYVSANNKKLKSVVIPDTISDGNGNKYKVTGIADSAFKNYKKLTKVTIGKNITKIGKNAFNGCKKLTKITIKSNSLKNVGKNAIKGISKKTIIKVPKKCISKYKKLFKSQTGYKKTMRIKK